MRRTIAEMIELTVLDLRVQMVLGCLSAEEPPFSQGALQECRERLIAAELDGVCSNGPWNWRSGRRRLTIASCPRRCEWRSIRVRLEGAGRVEHIQLAGPRGTQCGELYGRLARVDRGPGLTSGGHSPAPGVEYQARARHRLERGRREDGGAHDLSRQLDSLQSWLAQQLPRRSQPPLKEPVET